jgi:hypothetical protein
VGVGDGEGVGVGDGEGVTIGVGVTTGVGVGVTTGVGVGVGVDPAVVTTSCGGLVPSRDESARAVPFVVESPKLTRPLPVTPAVTFTLVSVPEVAGPDAPRLAPKGGAFESVIVVSPQVLSETEKAV